MSLSFLDHHMDDYLRHESKAREALDEGDFKEAWRQLELAHEASSEILNEAATIESDLEYLEGDIEEAEIEEELKGFDYDGLDDV